MFQVLCKGYPLTWNCSQFLIYYGDGEEKGKELLLLSLQASGETLDAMAGLDGTLLYMHAPFASLNFNGSV